MSYDFELYTSASSTPAPPPELADGNIVLNGPYKVEEEDISKSYLAVIGKKRWLYQIHLEGRVEHGEQGLVDDWLRNSVAAVKGVLIDLQTETFETSRISGPIASVDEAPSVKGAMSFNFQDGEGFYAHGFETMLRVVAKIFPKALPTRYGTYEPLQGKVEQGSYREIVEAFQEETDLTLKSPTPFGHIYMSLPCRKTFSRYHPRHFMRRHHMLGEVTFELRPKLFSNPSDLAALMRLFKALCVELDVVYAEILRTEEASTAWFWYGLPDRQTTHTICIGPEYQSVWPEVADAGESVGAKHRVFTTDRFGNTPPRPPVPARPC